jgi:hypothetical protein
MLFEPPHEELSDEEVAFRQSIAAAGRLSRQADLFLAGRLCREHLVDSLRAAGLLVMRLQWRLHQ